MTNEEAKAYFIDSNKQIISVAKDENMYNYETQQIEYVFMRRDFEAKELAIKALEQQPFINKPCISEGICHEDKMNVLNKIRAEIEQIADEERKYDEKWAIGLRYAVKIIDKYKAESEGRDEG